MGFFHRRFLCGLHTWSSNLPVQVKYRSQCTRKVQSRLSFIPKQKAVLNLERGNHSQPDGHFKISLASLPVVVSSRLYYQHKAAVVPLTALHCSTTTSQVQNGSRLRPQTHAHAAQHVDVDVFSPRTSVTRQPAEKKLRSGWKMYGRSGESNHRPSSVWRYKENKFCCHRHTKCTTKSWRFTKIDFLVTIISGKPWPWWLKNNHAMSDMHGLCAPASGWK